MSTPYNYEDSMRAHDAAVYSWLDGLLVDYNDINGEPRLQVPILKVFAAPHRAYAQAYDLLVKMGWAAGGSDAAARLTAEADWATLPLPICTIDRDYPMFTQELAASALTYERTFRDPVTGDWVQLPYPLHALTTYRLTFWCLKRYTEAYIAEWMYTRFGAIGAGNREVYLPVQHQAPFGRQLHSFKWIGTGDQSDLEGESPRYIRMTMTAMLRTWFMRGTWASARREPPVHAVQRQGWSEADLAATNSWWGSGNLWTIRDPTDFNSLATWPVDGAATVAADGTGGLVATLPSDADRVQLIELGTALLPNGYQILQVAGQISTDASVELFVDQFFGDPTPVPLRLMPKIYPDPPAIPVVSSFSPVMLTPELSGEFRIGAEVWAQSVPAGDVTFHEFTLSEGLRFVYGVQGGPAVATLSKINVRQIGDVTPHLAAYQIVDGGTEWVYHWNALEVRPYLIVVRVVRPAAAGAQITVDNDETSPTFSRTRGIAASRSLGVVILIQPLSGTLRVHIPKTLAVLEAYARPFDGPFLGGTLLP